MAVGRYWDDAKVGDAGVTPTITVTGAMIDMYADVSGDHTPLHVDEEYARKSHFGERVAHGLFGLAVADGRPQRYGTQIACKAGKLVVDYADIEDAEHVEERRRSMGFPWTLSEYEAFFADYPPCE